jgi:hypothetical protein
MDYSRSCGTGLGQASEALAGRPAPKTVEGHVAMLDFLMIAYGVGFFVVAILYVLACEKM